MNWFYIDESILEGDRRQGPVTFEDLQLLHSKKQINESTLVWHKGLDNWITWKEALDAELSNHSEEDERMLRETVEAILKERIEEFHKKSFAGFFVRAGALIIDWFILAIIWEAGVHVLDWLNLMDFNAIVEASNAFIEKYSADPMSANLSEEFMTIPGMKDLFLIWFILQTLYFVGFNGFLSATPGKFLLHLKIERSDGSKLKFSGALIRYIFSLFTQATLVFYGIGYIIAAIDPKKRALHDFFARTQVVHVRKRSSDSDEKSDLKKD
ncbi:MAG: RDD family protein [Fibrobacter sp.]|nr:RDD family protein [Fibrobacter sp.]